MGGQPALRWHHLFKMRSLDEMASSRIRTGESARLLAVKSSELRLKGRKGLIIIWETERRPSRQSSAIKSVSHKRHRRGGWQAEQGQFMHSLSKFKKTLMTLFII